MRFKVELRKEAIWYIKRICTRAARSAFYDELEKVRNDPISTTSRCFSLELSRTCCAISGSS